MPEDSISPLLTRSTVQLRLGTVTETIERVLYERVNLKIGRQVKSAIEKQGALDQPVSPPPIISNVDQENVDTVRIRADSTPVHPTFMNAPEEKTAPIANAESIWFKSKVVSRSHAEIWLKDGQVFMID